MSALPEADSSESLADQSGLAERAERELTRQGIPPKNDLVRLQSGFSGYRNYVDAIAV